MGLATMILLLAALGCAVASPAAPTLAPTAAAPVPTGGSPAICLPGNVKATEIVSAETGNGAIVRQVSVADKLKELQAYCSPDGRLLAPNGQEIYFYRLTGCWGIEPPGAREILQKQEEELKSLRQHYLVVEMTCNPTGIPRP